MTIDLRYAAKSKICGENFLPEHAGEVIGEVDIPDELQGTDTSAQFIRFPAYVGI